MVKAILRDIGGVLLTDPLLDDFWKGAEGSKELRTKFGEGKLDIEEFIAAGSSLLKVSPKEFKEGYISKYCTVTEVSKTAALVDFVNCPQYILSDTNPIHGEFVKGACKSLFSRFENIFLSYEIGMRKNSSDVFDYVTKEIGELPQEILFIDNREKLLNYAKEAGYQTFLFENASSLKTYLRKQKVLKLK